jgi:hypothetical protein
MLLKREDLRGRMIRLIGQGRISSTTRAMDDAGSRVARYLIMQLLVNVSFGSCIAIGLYFIGVPNAALDRITKKLARIFEVPIALITFIDRDHQWFKSQVGLPGEIAEAQHTSRELVCGHVIANDEILVVDVKPRRMTEREKRLLEVIGEDVMEEIKRRDSVGPPSVLVA